MQIPQITQLQLPDNYPTQEELNSLNQNRGHYDPHTWTHTYVKVDRYLSKLEDSDLRARYCAVLRNMRSYSHPERERISISSYRSSWYWFRKEHQTRLEFALRGISIEPRALNRATQGVSESPPSYMQTLDGKVVLFRYDKRKYIRKMVEQGLIRFSPAAAYEDKTHIAARRDNELERNSYLFDTPVTLIPQGGRLKGNRINLHAEKLQRTIPMSPYHLVCFSCVWDNDLFEEFEADTCAVVTDREELMRRLKTMGNKIFPNYNLVCGSVEYFDPYEAEENISIESANQAMYKDFQFAYQHECRIMVWSRSRVAPINVHQVVNIGPAQDIMQMLDKDGKAI